MINLFLLLLIVGCFSVPEIEPVPVPIETPIPAPVVTPEPTPTPIPIPIPVEVVVPQSVQRMTPFVVKHCGFKFDDRVRIILDAKYAVGGLMGWHSGCKRQTIQGLNKAGSRVLQFEVNGELQEPFWVLTVF